MTQSTLQDNKKDALGIDKLKYQRKEITGSCMMFINNCVGDVLLTVACRFGHLGIPTGFCLLTIAFIYQMWGFRIITKACAACNAKSLLDLLEKAFGPRIAMFIDVCACLMLFAVQVCYTLIISQYMHQAYDMITHTLPCMREDEVCTKKYKHVDIIIKISVGFVLNPLETFITSVQILNFISSFAIIFVIVTLTMIVVRSFQTIISHSLPHDTSHLYQAPVPAFSTHITILDIFADFTGMFAMFSLQPVIPPLYDEIQASRQIKEMILSRASDISTSVLYTMYLIAALLGALVFYAPNQPYFQNDNILCNFPSADVLMGVVRILYGLVIAFGYPVITFQIRASLASWIGVEPHVSRFSKVKFIGLGFSASIVCSIVAMFTPSILVIFDPFCATFGCVLFQIMPLMIWYKLPYLQKTAEPDIYSDFQLDRRTKRNSIITIAANMLTVSQRSSGSFRKFSKLSDRTEDSDVLEGDSLHDGITIVPAYNTQQQKIIIPSTKKRQLEGKQRKIVFYTIVSIIAVFNCVSFGVSILHIAKGEE